MEWSEHLVCALLPSNWEAASAYGGLLDISSPNAYRIPVSQFHSTFLI
jgi:hypothetical protein